MRPCDNCLEKNWRYEFNEGIVTATCQNCGAEVSFEARKRHTKAVDSPTVSLAERFVPWDAGDREGKLPWED